MSAKEVQELRKRYDTKHYNLLIDIERRCMKKDTRHIDTGPFKISADKTRH